MACLYVLGSYINTSTHVKRLDTVNARGLVFTIAHIWPNKG
jgi:hypothetical protein